MTIIRFIYTLDLRKINLFLEFSIHPISAADSLIIDKISPVSSDLPILKLSFIFAAIFEEKISFSVFFKIFDLPIIHLPIWILDLPFAYQIILFPFTSYDFSRGEYQWPFAVKLILQAIAYVLITVEKSKMSFDLDTILIKSSENYSVAVINLGFALNLVIFPMSEYFIAIAVCLGKSFDGLEAGRNSYLLKFFHLLRIDIFLLFNLLESFLVLLVLCYIELFDELGLKGPLEADL